jgi:hypothetical protein
LIPINPLQQQAQKPTAISALLLLVNQDARTAPTPMGRRLQVVLSFGAGATASASVLRMLLHPKSFIHMPKKYKCHFVTPAFVQHIQLPKGIGL